jgi:hypothetical protein
MCTTGYCVPNGAAESETGGETMDGYGTIRLEISPVGGDASIFDGTTSIRVTVNYESCLQDFYLSNPEFLQDGPDGMPVFDAWLYKLCADFQGTPVCVVEEIKQSFILANDVYALTIAYQIGEPENLADSELRVGPLPTSELAGCPAQVEVRQAGMVGLDSNGIQIWRISTLPAMNTAETDQATPIRVEVEATSSP